MNRRFLLMGGAALALPGCAGLRDWIDDHIDLEPEDIQRAARVVTRIANAAAGFIRGRLDAAGQAALDMHLPRLVAVNDTIQGTDMKVGGWGVVIMPAVKILLMAAAAVVPFLGLGASAAGLIVAAIATLQAYVDDVKAPVAVVAQVRAATVVP